MAGSKYPGLKNSIQTKLALLMALMLAVILGVNLFIFVQTNAMVERIDSVFASNVSIEELTDVLARVEGSVYEYLNTKSSTALENYYRYYEEYQRMAEELNDRSVNNSVLMLEKNIRGMSMSYLEKTYEAVQAKRGRNVEGYKAAYQEEQSLLRYIDTYIYELNRLQFSRNSDNYQSLLTVMHEMELMSLLIIVLVFVVSLGVATTLIRRMTRPLSALSGVAREVAEGNFAVEVPVVNSEDEIGIVTRTFDQMLDSIRAYIDRQRDTMQEQARLKERELSMEANLKEAQLKFLQAQINPHFLFNSLNAGAQLAVMEDADATGVFLTKMAEFFRYNLKKLDSDSTLAEEIELVDSYIYILNVRFAGDITYRKEVDPKAGSERVPSMILQPLVENAVSHGIREMMDRGEITLIVAYEDEWIRVSVKDNGIGMTQEQIAAIMDTAAEENAAGGVMNTAAVEDAAGGTMNTAAGENAAAGTSAGGTKSGGTSAGGTMDPESEQFSEHGNGIGLKNVISRLRLFYDQEGLLNIYSEGRMRGTEVTMLLPLERVEGDGSL